MPVMGQCSISLTRRRVRLSRALLKSAQPKQCTVQAASEAMKSWRELPAKARANILRDWFNIIMANQEDLARIMTLEQGKVIAESRGEVAYGASYIEWFAEQAKRIDGDVIPGPSPDKRIVCIKQPVGVCARHPLEFSQCNDHASGACTSAGCSIVIKPASETPLSALALAELAKRAGIPDGVLNVVVGSSSAIGNELTGSHIVRKLSFTGSTEVGSYSRRSVCRLSRRHRWSSVVTRPLLSLTMLILTPPCRGLISKYRNSGQTCVCSNRILVQSGVAEAFTQKLERN